MDRKSLEEAIRHAEGFWNGGRMTKIIVEAAKAHLETLPKMKMVWVVNGVDYHTEETALQIVKANIAHGISSFIVREERPL